MMLTVRFRLWVMGLTYALASLTVLRLLIGDPWFRDGEVPHAGYYDTFFTQQAISMLQGRLDVDPSVLPGECFVFEGKCFGYFGLTPSLLRIPFIANAPLWASGPDLGLSPIMVLAGLLLGLAASILLVDYLWKIASNKVTTPTTTSASRWIGFAYIIAMVAVGPGTLFLQLARPAAFEEAIIWAAALSLWGLLCLARWFHRGGNLNIVLAVGLFTLAASARASAAAMALGLSLLIIVFGLVRRADVNLRRVTPWALALAAVPLATLAWSFYAKFSSVMPDWLLNQQIATSTHWQEILQINGGRTFSPLFIPTILWTYLRPDAIGFRPDAESLGGRLQFEMIRPEYADISWLWPIDRGALYLEPTASLSVLVPAALILLVLALIKAPSLSTRTPSPLHSHPQTLSPWFTRIFILVGFSYAGLVLTTVAITNRYLGDFIPGVVLAVALGTVALAQLTTRHHRFGILLTLITAAAVVVGLVVNVILANTQLIERLAQASPL